MKLPRHRSTTNKSRSGDDAAAADDDDASAASANANAFSPAASSGELVVRVGVESGGSDEVEEDGSVRDDILVISDPADDNDDQRSFLMPAGGKGTRGGRGLAVGRRRPYYSLCFRSFGAVVAVIVAALFVLVALVVAGGSAGLINFHLLDSNFQNSADNFCFPNMTVVGTAGVGVGVGVGGIDTDTTTIDEFLDAIDSQSVEDRCSTATSRTPNNCNCLNPVRGSTRLDPAKNASWQVAFQNNLQLAHEKKRLQQPQQQLDVVMLGDSITEAWHGTEKAIPEEKFAGNALVYQQLFDSPNSPLQGLALGIAGDRCPQLLYRLQHGEIDELYPKLFWILIGTNDYLGERCNVDQIVAGNIRIVQELRSQRPNTTVVIQSLLPVGDLEGIIQYWDVYSEINQRLACFAQQQQAEQVHFVNVTQMFLTSNNTVNTSLFIDGLHPNGLGAALWGQEIVQTVRGIIDK